MYRGERMNMNQITSALTELFQEPLKEWEERKIIFWVDTNEEFTDEIEQMELENVKIHTLTNRNQFYTKHLLEEEDPASSYLIYTNLELDKEDNWLADTVLYSKTFYADRISLLVADLAMESSFKQVLKKHEKFFNNRERFRKFKAFQIEQYSEELIELAIMSVLCNLKTPNFEAVLKTVLMDTLEDEDNKYLHDFKRFFDVEIFWQTVANLYGYEREVQSLKTLMIHLTVTAFSHSVDEKYLSNVQDYIAERNRTNSLVFIDHWMHHKVDDKIYHEYAAMVEKELDLQSILKQIPIDEFKQADVFPYIDRAIIIYIVNGLATQLEDYEEYNKLIKLRRAKHYYEQYSALYDALYYTVKIHEFHKTYAQGLPQGYAIDLYEAYTSNYYKMDYYYRKFYVAYDREDNHEVMKKLKAFVEKYYTNWYMLQLNDNWTKAVKKEMTEQWSLPGIQNQQNFYHSYVEQHIRKDERVFVIISDALRYEIGVEVAEKLNAETIGESEIQSLLSVVPSVTKLGMAALLPHGTLDIDDNAKVMIDGMSTSGIQNREKILLNVTPDSIAIHANDMIAMNKAIRRETFKGKKLVYIYHDAIDAIGDQAATEIQTFDAAEQAVNDIYNVVKMIRDDLSGTNIYITADHGFIYQRDPLEESDKLAKAEVNPIEMKRRYLLAQSNTEQVGQLAVNMSSIIENTHGLTAYMPNSTIRYRLQGSGVNFVHGGASLQEVVVPLIIFKNKRAGQKGAQTLEKVQIRLTSSTRRITNSLFSLDFFQSENIEGKIVPRTVVVYMANRDGAVLSDEHTIIGDRNVEHPADRTFKISFAMKSMTYDRNETYYLVMKDAETGVIQEKIPFTINLGIINDFDF